MNMMMMILSTPTATLPFKSRSIDSHPSQPNLLFSSTRSLAESRKWRNKVSFFQGFLTGGRDVQSLKLELYETIAPLDRGAEATLEDQQRLDKIASKLEAVNSVKEPLKSDMLNGKWELLYTTSQSILQTQRPKLLRPNGKIYQAINVDTLRAQNIETWPFYNQATANLVPLNSKRVAVKFDLFKIASLRAQDLLCMENEPVSIHQPMHHILNLASLLNSTFISTNTDAADTRWVSWHPDEGMALVLNVDGSSLGDPGTFGFGVVLRKLDGSWIYGFGGNIGISTVLHVELLAIYHDLKAAWEKGYVDIICYSDSTLAIQLVHAPVNPWHHFASIICNIQDLVKRRWRIQIVHTLKEANSSVLYGKARSIF